MNAWLKKGFIVVAICLVVVAVIRLTNLHNIVTLETIQRHREWMYSIVLRNWYVSLFSYIVLFASAVAFTIPITGPLLLAAGFLFGFTYGLAVSIIGITLGIICAVPIIRYAFDYIMSSVDRQKVNNFQKSVNRYGYTYLLTVNLMAIFPFFIILVAAIAAGVPFVHILWTCVLGSLPTMTIYVFAGTQISTVSTVSELFSWMIIFLLLLLVMLSLLPMYFQRRKKLVHEEVDTPNSSDRL